MQTTFDIIHQHVIEIINKYNYQLFNGPLTYNNFPTLIETIKQKDTSRIYHVLNKSDMETRINFLQIMKYLANPYTISNKKTDYCYSIFTWEDYKIFNLYRLLKEKDKQKFWKFLSKENIFFECLSPDLLLLGFKIDKKYKLINNIKI